MVEKSGIAEANTKMIYAFRFDTCNKIVCLNDQQLNHIPYLYNVVTHKDDFLSIQNESGEYVLHHTIKYTWFMPILLAITSEQAYMLFNELSEDENILDALQLFDYLGIDSFQLPLLKDENLVRSISIKTDNDEEPVQYFEANLFQARQTAAQFIIAVSKNEYNLSDSHTIQCIFGLIKIILSYPAVFSSRFRHHTLTVTKECCYWYFSKAQQHLLPTIQQIALHSKAESFMYLYDDDNPLPRNFRNAFAWKGIYVSKKEYYMNSSLNSFNLCKRQHSSSEMLDIQLRLSQIKLELTEINYELWMCELNMHEEEQNNKNNEARLARKGHFNTLPKQPKVDKFKHRSQLKVRKYR